jgi:hypothetical protein
MRTSLRLTTVSVIVVLTVAAGTAASAAPAGATGLIQVSHGSPFAGCTVGATPTSTLYPGAEVEPSVANSRLFPGEVVGAWQQDRWSNGGSHGIASAFSRDGGRTFNRSVWPVSRCAPHGLAYDRASDPWVSIGPEGVVYGSALTFDANTARNAVVATTSYDGGRTWRNTTELIKDTESTFVDDKNSVTADPVRPGSAYQIWDRLELSADGALLFGGPTLLSTTRDFGRTWSAPQTIVHTRQFQQTIGNVIVADSRTGALYDVYESLQFTDATASQLVFARSEVVRSTDGGRTWSAPSIVANDSSVGDVDPNTGAQLRTGAGLPQPAIDPRTGELYVVYEGTDFTGGAYNQIQLVHSVDGGRTWSGPTRVNGDPAVQAFTPAIAVSGAGDVGITYYDLRTLKPNNTTTLPTSTWLTIAPRGSAHFDRERQIAPVFDHLQAPNAFGLFLGDYQGLATFGNEFRALFVTTNANSTGNRTDVHFGQFASSDHDDRTPAAAAPNAAGGSATATPHLRRTTPVRR